ncbi:probable protein phosphatase 2C 24 [Rhododendron vialii]|uniref:probable protein phosphatase 2C 24 n=1 Tax=Rhododendron vialii TaxID=182163 RepID=UPI00265E9E5D|nr:probable protein phosphatase 2C 24 [Rhododendron vialii]
MAQICCEAVSESETTKPCEPSSRATRRRRIEMRRIKFGCGGESESNEQKLDLPAVSMECDNAVENSDGADGGELVLRSESEGSGTKGIVISDHQATLVPPLVTALVGQDLSPKFGAASICGRRRDMEDAVAIHPFLCRREQESATELHYFGVYDGHGCSHVAMRCRDRLHELVKEELGTKGGARTEWKNAMEKSFGRMDEEVILWNGSEMASNCRCELQTPECDAVGSTAVVAIVTPDKIIVANCGDSRAVLCRNGRAVPLSTDHKPDRPDELSRIQAAGGRVLYWDCPRVGGVLAMSRAIGDNYLKPSVICEPEVTITDRTMEDDCLILASDGLWDVVSNDTACGVARMCLRGMALVGESTSNSCLLDGESVRQNADKACSDASMLLTKLALARCSSDNVSIVVIDLKRGI